MKAEEATELVGENFPAMGRRVGYKIPRTGTEED